MMLTIDQINERDAEWLADSEPVAPQGLHVRFEPYPHLRDDGGAIISSDLIDFGKTAFILKAVAEKIAREAA